MPRLDGHGRQPRRRHGVLPGRRLADGAIALVLFDLDGILVEHASRIRPLPLEQMARRYA